MTFFARVKETVKNLAPQDDYDRIISSLVSKGTSEDLLTTDWDVSLQLVDLVNQSDPEWEDVSPL